VDDTLSADSIYSMTFTWIKILYSDDDLFFRRTFMPFSVKRTPGEEHAWLWEPREAELGTAANGRNRPDAAAAAPSHEVCYSTDT
jgi:hypothetical protein